MTRFLPFGGYRPGSAPTQTITDRDFTGQRENMELGLLYYNARFYAPTLGKFISADTIIPNPANPQSYNRYAYVLNRALNFFDPTGHMDTPFDSGGGLGTPVPRHYCTESYGCFDREHIEAGALKLNDVIAKIGEAIKTGDSFPIRGGFGPTLGGRGSGFVAYYSVSGTIAPEQIPGVAIGILIDYETRWEELQGCIPFGAPYQSSFSIEDLPSDYLGWMLALNSEGGSVGEAMAEAFSLLGGAKAVSNVPHPVRSQPWIHEGSMTPTSVLMPIRNREFTPLVSTESGDWQNVSWPNELQITPIESSANTWQFAGSGYCVFGFGDCGNP
jgi:RHS repeat-associated protein